MKGTAGKVYQTSVFVSNKVAQYREVFNACCWLIAVILIFSSAAVSHGLCLKEEEEIACQFLAYLNFFKAPVNDSLKYFPTLFYAFKSA